MDNIQEEETLELNHKEAKYISAVVERPGSIAFRHLEKPQIGEKELWVKMIGVGMCASTIPLWEGREWFDYPLKEGAPGHEGWGIIEEKGLGVTDFQVGQLVAMLSGNALATYSLINSRDAVIIPEELGEIPFPGEPFGCLMNIFKRADIQEGHSVAIIGLGFLGQGLVTLAKKKGAHVVALSRRDSALDLATDADLTQKMDDHYKIIEKLNGHTEGKGFDRVIECTGKQWPLDLATAIIGDYGKLIIAGYHQDGLRNVNMQQWNWKAIDVINAHERDPEKYLEGIREAIKAIKTGLIDPYKLLTHEYSFNQLPEAFDTLRACPEGYIKGFIKF